MQDREGFEFLQRLKRIGVDGCDTGGEGGGENQKSQRTLGDSDTHKKDGEDEFGEDEGDKEDDSSGNEDPSHQCLHLAEFLARGKSVDLLHEDHCENGNWHGEGRGKIRQGHDRAEFLCSDVFRDEPESDEDIQRIGGTAR